MKKPQKPVARNSDDLLKLVASAVGIGAVLSFFMALSQGAGFVGAITWLASSFIGLSFFGSIIFFGFKLLGSGANREKSLWKIFWGVILFFSVLILIVSLTTG